MHIVFKQNNMRCVCNEHRSGACWMKSNTFLFVHFLWVTHLSLLCNRHENWICPFTCWISLSHKFILAYWTLKNGNSAYSVTIATDVASIPGFIFPASISTSLTRSSLVLHSECDFMQIEITFNCTRGERSRMPFGLDIVIF